MINTKALHRVTHEILKVQAFYLYISDKGKDFVNDKQQVFENCYQDGLSYSHYRIPVAFSYLASEQGDYVSTEALIETYNAMLILFTKEIPHLSIGKIVNYLRQVRESEAYKAYTALESESIKKMSINKDVMNLPLYLLGLNQTLDTCSKTEVDANHKPINKYILLKRALSYAICKGTKQYYFSLNYNAIPPSYREIKYGLFDIARDIASTLVDVTSLEGNSSLFTNLAAYHNDLIKETGFSKSIQENLFLNSKKNRIDEDFKIAGGIILSCAILGCALLPLGPIALVSVLVCILSLAVYSLIDSMIRGEAAQGWRKKITNQSLLDSLSRHENLSDPSLNPDGKALMENQDLVSPSLKQDELPKTLSRPLTNLLSSSQALFSSRDDQLRFDKHNLQPSLNLQQ